MKIIIGLFYIFSFYFIGESISHFSNHFIPGNIIGMLLFFFCLHYKLISVHRVKDAALGLTKNMTLFFIPPAVGLMEYTGLINKFWFSIIVICVITTLLVQGIVGWIQQIMGEKEDAEI